MTKHLALALVLLALSSQMRAFADDDLDLEDPAPVDAPLQTPHVDEPVEVLDNPAQHPPPTPAIPPQGLPHRDAFVRAWATARDCLVGAPPWTANQGTARGIQAILGVDRATCGALAAAARDVAESADDPGFHTGWFDVAHSLGALAAGVQPGRAIARVDADLARLLGVVVPTTRARIAPFAIPPTAPVLAGTEGAKPSITEPIFEHEVIVELTDPETDEYRTAVPTVAWPEPAWHAYAVGGKIDNDPPPNALEWASVLERYEHGAERLLVLQRQRTTVLVARSHDGGRHWSAPVEIARGAQIQIPSDGHGVVVASHVSKSALALDEIASDTTMSPRLVVPVAELQASCSSPAGVLWVERDTGRTGFTPRAHAPSTVLGAWPDAELVACSGGGAVLRAHDAIVRCDATACTIVTHTSSHVFADLRARDPKHVVWAGHDGPYVVIGATDRPTRVVQVSEGELVGVRGGDLLLATARGVVQVTP